MTNQLRLLVVVTLLIGILAVSPATFAQGPGAELEQALAGEFDGAEVTIMTLWPEANEEGVKFQAVLDVFEEATGITVLNEGTREFETLLPVRVEGGDPPDVAMIAQPGLMRRLKDAIVPLDDIVDRGFLEDNYNQFWLDLVTFDGALYGIYFRAQPKSLVWYNVAAFEEFDYAIPQTWDELMALQDQMVADGNTPWCIGIEQAAATGWVATDWVEDIVLRADGIDVYNQWVAHEIPFNDERIVAAVQMMGDIWLNEDYVYGGTTFILTTNTGDSVAPMFNDPPDCLMHKQAGWITAFFPEGFTAPEDSTFFYLPPMSEDNRPVLGAADAAAMFNDRPEVRAFMQWLATPEAAAPWVALEGFIPANRNVSLESIPNELDRAQVDLVNNATAFGFDASDLMPSEVGAGTFWQGMVDYVGGENLEDIMLYIEESWPTE